MKRGSLVLAAYLYEGDPSPEFFDAVNQLIEEDGDVEPVLTGTINLGVTLLHLASMATNTTPQSILASFGEGDEERQVSGSQAAGSRLCSTGCDGP